MLRSPRLEALFGKRLNEVTFADVEALVGNEEAAETSELDYKKLVHARSGPEKTEFRKDAIAMGNSGGGILLVGVEEDDAAVPAALPGVDITDAEQRRLRALLHEVSPFLPVDIRVLKDPGQEADHGVMIILIEGSSMAPHALLSTTNETHHKDGWMRFPVRDGASTRWMKEPEVATRYRARWAEARNTRSLAQERERQAILDFEERCLKANPPGYNQVTGQPNAKPPLPLIAATIVPESPGTLQIDRAALADFQRSFWENPPLIGRDVTFDRARVAPGRLIGQLGEPIISLWTELHSDGSGTFLLALPPSDDDKSALIGASEAVFYLLSGARFLGRHARERAGATGIAAVRVSLLGGTESAHGIAVGSQEYSQPDDVPITLSYEENYSDYLGLETATQGSGTAYAHVDDLASDSHELVSAVALAVNEVFQAFGVAEAPQLDARTGVVKPDYWRLYPEFSEWARSAGLTGAKALAEP